MGGKMILNGKEYMGGKSAPYKEVTLSEYNALPASKLTNGIAYYIKDLGNSYSYPPLIYSDEEREIGVWRDGRPLYEKTIDFGYLPNNDVATVSTGLTNIIVRSITGCCYSQSSGQNLVIPNVSASDAVWQIAVYLTNNGSTLNIRSGADRSDMYAYITLQYTKTTDTPGSGIWTTQGGYAHHYSTTEHVIGTWIDGKPLYEKTVIFGAISGGAQFNIQSGVTTVDTLIDVNVMCMITGGGYMKMPLSFPASAEVNEQWGTGWQSFSKSTGYFRIDTGAQRDYLSGFAIFRYTKTTD